MADVRRLCRALPWGVSGILAFAIACTPQQPPPAAPPPETAPVFGNNPYCPAGVVLCSALPGDKILLPQGCADYDQQCARDFQSWQNFVSLNWPGKIVHAPEGVTLVEPDPSATVGGAGSRVWELWMDPDSVFLPAAVKPNWNPGSQPPVNCGTPIEGKGLIGRLAKASVSFDLDPDSFFTATINQPLIDQDLNFVVFEIRMNQQEVGWVISNTLYQQEVVDGLATSVTLPGDAIETKAAWRILPDDMPESQKARYYRQMATLVLDADHVAGSTGGLPVCIRRELGLIGLHIRHEGLWSTFEQVDNVTARDGIAPTLNNPACTTCATNVPPTDQAGKPIPPSEYKWSLTGPSASLYQGFPNVPAQITFAPGQVESIDADMNHWWQTTVLTGTVWANYMLITTNWIEEENSQPIPSLNTSLEPFLPSKPTFPQACIDCHKLATNGNNAEIGMTFLPFRACPAGSPTGPVSPNCLLGQVDTLAGGD